MPSTASGTALLIAARTCSSFGRSALVCAAMCSSTDFGTLCFIPLILCFGMRIFLAGLPFLQRCGRAATFRTTLQPFCRATVFQAEVAPIDGFYVRTPHPDATRAGDANPCGRDTRILR